MKNVIIFHGTSSTPNSFWFPYLKTELEIKGCKVSIPALPKADHPDLKNWLSVALAEDINEETVLIGHSAGAPLILSVSLQGTPAQKETKKSLKQFCRIYIIGKKIKSNIEDLIFINSDNDPWGCNDVEGKYMLDNLGGTLIIKKGEGHMGSDSFNQPYKKFPLLVKLID